MKKDEVKIGGVYTAKITGRIARVRIDSANRNGGWNGTNLDTKRPVRIRSAAKLRGVVSAGDKQTGHAPQSQLTLEETKKLEAKRKAPGNGSSSKKDKTLSALDAAAKVLGESDKPLNAKEMIDAMAAKGYWKSPGGKTPHATLYAAILRELKTKGSDSRFKKTERGKFTLAQN